MKDCERANEVLGGRQDAEQHIACQEEKVSEFSQAGEGDETKPGGSYISAALAISSCTLQHSRQLTSLHCSLTSEEIKSSLTGLYKLPFSLSEHLRMKAESWCTLWCKSDLVTSLYRD